MMAADKRQEVTGMFCHNCGQSCQIDARFCTRCGSDLSLGIPTSQQVPPIVPPPQPPMPRPATYPPAQQPVVYIYRDAPASVTGSFKVPLIILLILALVGLTLYISIPISANRVIQTDSQADGGFLTAPVCPVSALTIQDDAHSNCPKFYIFPQD